MKSVAPMSPDPGPTPWRRWYRRLLGWRDASPTTPGHDTVQITGAALSDGLNARPIDLPRDDDQTRSVHLMEELRRTTLSE